MHPSHGCEVRETTLEVSHCRGLISLRGKTSQTLRGYQVPPLSPSKPPRSLLSKVVAPWSSARRLELERLGLPREAMQEGAAETNSEIPTPGRQTLKPGAGLCHRKWEGGEEVGEAGPK